MDHRAQSILPHRPDPIAGQFWAASSGAASSVSNRCLLVLRSLDVLIRMQAVDDRNGAPAAGSGPDAG